MLMLGGTRWYNSCKDVHKPVSAAPLVRAWTSIFRCLGFGSQDVVSEVPQDQHSPKVAADVATVRAVLPEFE